MRVRVPQIVRRTLCSAAGGEKGTAAELIDAITPNAECGSDFYKLRAWHVATGDTVKRNDALCEIETAAFTFDYVWEGEEAVLHEKLIREGADDVVAGSVLARLVDPAAVAEDLPLVEEPETDMDAPFEKRALIVDMDASIAGAHALVLLAAQRETTRIPFVSASYGSVPVDAGVGTLRALLGSLSCAHVPVVRGAAAPLSGRAHTPALRLFAAGDDGIGGAPLDTPADVALAPPPSSPALSAAEQIVATLRADPLEYSIVVLGPLTNVALALRLDPGVADCIEHLVWAGGMCGGGVGTASAAAEANAWADPDAAAEVLSALTCTIVPWDAALLHAVDYDWADKEWLSSTSPHGVVNKAVTPHVYKAFEAEHTAFGNVGRSSSGGGGSALSSSSSSGGGGGASRGALPLPAALAMAIALEPSIVLDAKKRVVAVETGDGAGRGATLVDMRSAEALAALGATEAAVAQGGKRATIVESVDNVAFRRLLVESVAGAEAEAAPE